MRLKLAVSLLLVAVALSAGAGDWKRWADALASDGEADFLTAERAGQIRFLFLAAAGLPWLTLLARRPAPGAAPAAERGWLLELALLGAFALAGSARIARVDPMTKDTKFYLHTALDIRSSGGARALPLRCLRGEYLEDNRHPLYLGMLATCAEPSQRFVDRARLVSLAGAVAALGALLLTARRRWGRTAALLGAALLASNAVFVEHATSVACESWLGFFALLWWSSSSATPRGGALAGAASGLAWLTKGTGVWFVLVDGLEAGFEALRGRTRSLRERARSLAPFAAALAAFCVVASPLLVRNVRVFGSPLYNLNSSRLMWLDRWAEFADPVKVAAASPWQWLATHSFGDALARLASGAAKQAWHVVEAAAPLGVPVAFGLPLVLAAALGLRRLAPREARRLASLFAIAFAGLAWYAQIASDVRFLGALVPLAALPLAALASGLDSGARAARVLRGSVALLALAFLAAGVLRPAPRPAPGEAARRAVEAWLLDGISKDDKVEFLAPLELGRDWTHDVHATRRALPRDAAQLAALLESGASARVRYVVAPLDAPAVAQWTTRSAEGAVGVGSPPRGWRLEALLPLGRPEVAVFAR